MSASSADGQTIATLLRAEAYFDSSALEREQTAIFAREWSFVADASQLAASGDYVATSVAGQPIIIVNDNGVVRAMRNVCRHRGGPLVWPGAGSCSGFVCRYHGWSYALDGSLQHARDFGDDDLDTAQFSLAPVRVDTWRGLTFASLDAAAPTLLDWLGGFADACAAYPIEAFRAVHRSSHHIAANWKVYAENYQEGYHIPLVHPGLNRQIDARRYEVDVRDGYSVHSAPTRDGSVTAGVWLWRFPGIALNVYGDGMCLETYAPTGPQSTQVDYVFFFADDTTDEERDAAIRSSDAILNEDRTICEAVQRNMASGAWRGGVLSPRHELGVLDFQRRVVAALAASADND